MLDSPYRRFMHWCDISRRLNRRACLQLRHQSVVRQIAQGSEMSREVAIAMGYRQHGYTVGASAPRTDRPRLEKERSRANRALRFHVQANPQPSDVVIVVLSDGTSRLVRRPLRLIRVSVVGWSLDQRRRCAALESLGI